MNWTQKIIILAAMLSIFVYDQLLSVRGVKYYAGAAFLVVLAVAGIIMTRDKKKDKPKNDRKKDNQ